MSAVEAKSLSSLTALAFNPPAYPRNPTHVKHEPLVLYIARVPGSRDVFLSPMKPRDKVVTAEDIQSCLYYIHVNEPEDFRLISQFPPIEANDPLLTTGNSASPISRKAVPTNPTPDGAPAVPRRKPLPGVLSPINDFENTTNVHASTYYQNAQDTARSKYAQRNSLDPAPYVPGADFRPPLPPRRPPQRPPSPPRGTSLTLIRRDPASNAQWNVACIDDPAVFDVCSSAPNDSIPRKKLGAPVYMEITNPGYSKFLNGPDRPELISRMNDITTRSHPSGMKAQAEVPFAPSPSYMVDGEPDQDDTVFRRRLWMEMGKHQSDHMRAGSHEMYLGRRRQRSSSGASPISTETPGWTTPLDPQDQPYLSTGSDIKSSFRGYVFLSPWNGRCEFITGAAGGSLKCRHVVPGLQGGPPAVMQVSELRFNLPSSSKSTSTANDEPSKRSSLFHRPKHSRNNSSVSEMDLSLGQEHAGGGYGGKQAKLGKLIIEDEGLKMLDLLVAANMALYWRAYEKVDARSRGDRSSA